jgi:acyl carrier protein
MKTSAPTSVIHPTTSTDRETNLRHLPAAARAAFERFQAGGDPATLDPVLFAILEDYVPHSSARPLAELPGDTRLIDDLGFDSMAITEVVFFTEDLFGINITNEEIIQVRTLDDLRGFIRRKVTLQPMP